MLVPYGDHGDYSVDGQNYFVWQAVPLGKRADAGDKLKQKNKNSNQTWRHTTISSPWYFVHSGFLTARELPCTTKMSTAITNSRSSTPINKIPYFVLRLANGRAKALFTVPSAMAVRFHLKRDAISKANFSSLPILFNPIFFSSTEIIGGTSGAVSRIVV